MARSQFLVVTNYIRKTIIYKLSSLSLSFRVNLSKYLYKTTRTRTRGFGFGFFFDSTQKINKYLFLLLFFLPTIYCISSLCSLFTLYFTLFDIYIVDLFYSSPIQFNSLRFHLSLFVTYNHNNNNNKNKKNDYR